MNAAVAKGTFDFVRDVAHTMPVQALGDVLGVPQRVVRVAGFDLPAGVGKHGADLVGTGEEGVGTDPVDGPGARGKEGGDVGGDVVVEDGGHFGEWGDVGVVEGVDAPVHVVAGADAGGNDDE